MSYPPVVEHCLLGLVVNGAGDGCDFPGDGLAFTPDSESGVRGVPVAMRVISGAARSIITRAHIKRRLN